VKLLYVVLKQNRPKHEFDASITFQLVLFRFVSFAYRRIHCKQTTKYKDILYIVVDEASNHGITRYSKFSVKIIQTTMDIASRRFPDIRHNFVGKAVGSERSAVFNQLD
jgi:hypothetical protein